MAKSGYTHNNLPLNTQTIKVDMYLVLHKESKLFHQFYTLLAQYRTKPHNKTTQTFAGKNGEKYNSSYRE